MSLSALVSPSANDIAFRTLQLAAEDTPPSKAFLRALEDFLTRCPQDTNFIVELGDPQDASMGGAGYGIITCMEQGCMKDIRLGPDPVVFDGGQSAGIGSFAMYEEHCRDLQHQRGKAQRLGVERISAKSRSSRSIASSSRGEQDSPSFGHKLTPSKSLLDTLSDFDRGVHSVKSLTTSSTHHLTDRPKPGRAMPTWKTGTSPPSHHSKRSVGTSLVDELDSEDETSSILPIKSEPLRSLSINTNTARLPVKTEKQMDFKPHSGKARGASSLSALCRQGSKEEPLILLSDSDEATSEHDDDEVRILTESEIPADCRKVTNKDNPVILDDDDDEEGISVPASISGIGSQPARPSSSKLLQSLRQQDLHEAFHTHASPSEHSQPPSNIQDTEMVAPTPSTLGTPRTGTAGLKSHRGAGAQANAASSSSRPLWVEKALAAQIKAEPNPSMPGAFVASTTSPSAASSSNWHLETTSQIPAGSHAGALPGDLSFEQIYGEELDRPRTSEGIASLFQTALDDFHEDTKIEEAAQKIGLDADGTLNGLHVKLLPHQIIGVSWMLKQEASKRTPGGILGDEMGLGKTIQTIATMLRNRGQDRKVRTTLVVAPLALLQQWKLEVETKSTLKAYIYHGPGKSKSKNFLRDKNVVITTYGSLVGERGGEVERKKKKRRAEDDFVSDDEPPKTRKKGPLYQIHWHRVVLDEAARIRNRNTIVSKAVNELNSDINWCLTGTLIHNSLTDLYAYLRFIGTISWEDFRDSVHSCQQRRPKLATTRAQALLRKVMLRRNKGSEINGKKILQLPEKTVERVYLELSKDERAIYDSVEARARVRVNKYMRNGTVLKHYHVVLVMLMRLRQLCCHPWLLRAKDGNNPNSLTVSDEELFGDADLTTDNAVAEVTRAVATMGQDWVDKVREKLKKRHDDIIRGDGQDEDAQEADENDYTCPVCMEHLVDERVTTCQHSFCAICIDEVLTSPLRDAHFMTDEQAARAARLCPLCRTEIRRDQLFRGDALFQPPSVADEDENLQKPGSSTERLKREWDDEDPGSGKKVKTEIGKRGSFLFSDEDVAAEDIDERGIENVLPSTKMKQIGDIIAQIYEKDPKEKTLVFCTFVEMLELVSVYLKRHGVLHVLYTGKLKPDDREDAIKEFNALKGPNVPRVMLISLTCGGVGLNLTVANNVINLDLAWSPAAELQAVDRAHRIGQTRPVVVRRLIIKNSVEERILQLQEKKQALADGAMGEGTGGKLKRLTARELVALFGRDDGHD